MSQVRISKDRLDMGGAPIENLGAPSSAGDAATKNYIDTKASGRGTVTYIVAASNSASDVKAQADYVCDGVADEVEINAAIDALPDGGGIVHLAAGEFLIDSSVLLNHDRLGLEGSGWGFWGAWLAGNPAPGSEGDGVTKIKATATGFDLLKFTDPRPTLDRWDGIYIKDLYLYGNSYSSWGINDPIGLAQDQMLIERVFVHKTNGGIRYAADAGVIRDSTVMDVTGVGIQCIGGPFPMIIRNIIADVGGNGIEHLAFQGIIANNLVTRANIGILTGGAGNDWAVIVGNQCHDNRAEGIRLDFARYSTVSHNVIHNETYTENPKGIVFNESTENVLMGNVVQTDVASSSAAIEIPASSTGNELTGNMIRGSWGARYSNLGGSHIIDYDPDADAWRFQDDVQIDGNVGFNGQSPSAPPTYTPSNVVTDRSFDANSTSTEELADVLGTLIADLQAKGLLQ